MQPKILWYALTTTVTMILGMAAWGIHLMEGAIQRNTVRVNAMEIRVAELAHECDEIAEKLDRIGKEQERFDQEMEQRGKP